MAVAYMDFAQPGGWVFDPVNIVNVGTGAARLHQTIPRHLVTNLVVGRVVLPIIWHLEPVHTRMDPQGIPCEGCLACGFP